MVSTEIPNPHFYKLSFGWQGLVHTTEIEIKETNQHIVAEIKFLRHWPHGTDLKI
jgi:hypothetical protein